LQRIVPVFAAYHQIGAALHYQICFLLDEKELMPGERCIGDTGASEGKNGNAGQMVLPVKRISGFG
jgi:hypothetical protein